MGRVAAEPAAKKGGDVIGFDSVEGRSSQMAVDIQPNDYELRLRRVTRGGCAL